MSLKLKNFTDMTLIEKKMVLKWRNNKNITKWMYNKNNIMLQEHLDYIKKLKNMTNKKYFLVKNNDKYIGVISFTDINVEVSSTTLGLYINPFEKGKGFGKLLIETAIRYSTSVLQVKRLKLEVFENNARAIFLYKQYNFQEISKDVINNNKVICMELNNEYR